MGEEGKYSPNLGAMDVDHLEGAGKAAKNLADRRFAEFEDDIQMIINLQVLSIEDQKTLMNRFVSTIGRAGGLGEHQGPGPSIDEILPGSQQDRPLVRQTDGDGCAQLGNHPKHHQKLLPEHGSESRPC